jgi:hypothetical protein
MARKCHRQESGTHFIFFGEQFWGRAARASWTRKGSGRSLFLGTFLTANRSRDSRCIPVMSLLGFKRVVQFVEMVKLTVILA